jgi:heat shock protein HslJ
MTASMMLLAGSEWGPADGGEQFVQFRQQGLVAGSGGCNRFSGRYTQDGDRIRLTELASTKMACADEAVMRKERVWFDLLAAARRIEATQRKLVLRDESGGELAILLRRDWD